MTYTVCYKGGMLVSSPAKINLGLSITGRRESGYHEIQSLFWPLDFGDDIFIREAENNSVEMRFLYRAPRRGLIPLPEQNIAFRALQWLSGQTGKSWAVQIGKRIPMGAGLGGGSSNAGTLLRTLGADVDPQLMMTFAMGLGADVPFFLSPVPSWISGIGEIIEPAHQMPASPHFLLVFPAEGLATAEVFRRFRGAWDAPLEREIPFFSLVRNMKNSLQDAAIELMPELGIILQSLSTLDALGYGMSGSGSTCFAVFDSAESCRGADKLFSNSFRTICCGTFVPCRSATWRLPK